MMRLAKKLRKLGNEFGATTGRPRRCGWIDLVALKFACMINGVTKIVMTKADVLDTFGELKICTSYKLNGKESKEIPFQMERQDIEPFYKIFNGWNTNISAAKSYDKLPEAMKAYVDFIGQYLDVKIQYISNGPGREQLINVN